MVARQAAWRRKQEQEGRRRRRQKEEGDGDDNNNDGLPPSLDDPDVFLPHLGVLRCLLLKRLNPQGYAELMAAPVRVSASLSVPASRKERPMTTMMIVID